MNKIKVKQYADGRWGFDDYSQGERRRVRLETKQQALERAADTTVIVKNGRHDLLDIDARELAEFRKWKSACRTSPPVADACREFLARKANKSGRYVKSITLDLRLFEEFVGSTQTLGGVTALDIQRFLDSRTDSGERRKFNLRASIVALFRWARRQKYVQPDPSGMTEAENVEKITKRPGQVNVLTADQMRILLDNVNQEYLPWLCIGGFAGIRTEEIAPDRDSKKSPLAWEDFDWSHNVIIVRVETSKVGQEREVPISPNLAEWLAPYRNATGPVRGTCPRQPTDKETGRLGRLIGGWKHNALRDSYCSYRTRITQNVPQTSYEMGNSPAMVKRSYHRRQSIEAAQAWFDIRPREASNVVRLDKAA